MNFFSWKTVPFARFVPPLVLGIITAVFLDVSTSVGAALIVFGIAGLAITEMTKNIGRRVFLEHKVLLPISALLFGLGVLLVDMNTTLDAELHFSKTPTASFLKGQVTEAPQSKKKSVKVVLDVQSTLRDSVWSPSVGSLLVYLEKSDEAFAIELGDELLIPAEYKVVTPPANPGEFNYKRFLSFRDIYHQLYVPTGQWACVGQQWSVRKQAEHWRMGLRSRLGDIGMDDDEVAIASALLLGKKDELGPEITRSYASAGAMHVLAVSGLHVGIIYFILQSLLRWMGRLNNGAMIRALILILGLWVYAFITGLSPSVVRAATMFSAVSLATGLNRRSNIYNSVASSAFLLLLFNPFYIMEVGFQLSYLAVLGIIYLHPKIYNLLYFPEKLPDKLWEISAVSISAQLATFPLGLLYFHQFPTYFLLSNLIVIPAAFLILYLGLSYLALCWVPIIESALGFVFEYAIVCLNAGVAWVERLPYSLIQGVDISIWETWLIYLLIASTLIAFIYRKRKAFITAVAGLVLLMLLQVMEVIQFERHPYLIVYDVRGDTVVNLLSNQENLVYADSLWVDDESKQQFHLKNNWNRHAAPSPIFIKKGAHPTLVRPIDPVMLYRGKSVVIIDERDDLTKIGSPIKVDFLVLSYFRGLRMKVILDKISAEQIILDSSIRGKSIEYICGDAEGEPIHAVSEDGYFAVRL